MISLRWLILSLALSTSAGAQDDTSGVLSRALELPAHKALMRLKTRSETDLAPFRTDGCSGGLSQVWQVVGDRFPDFADAHHSVPPWEACCVTHDRAYHDGAAAKSAGDSFDARLIADRELRACVTQTGASRFDDLARFYDVTPDQIALAYDSIAQAMFLAVRFGGAPCSGLPWRWGYGFPGCTVLTGALD